MVLMIDTNILLDVLQEREPHLELSLRIWSLCDYDKSVTGYILSASLLNIAYIMRKELTPDRIQEIYMTLVPAFKFIDLREADLEAAANMKWPDFEDAVMSAIAERIKADYIITRNVKDFNGSKVKAITPEEYFEDIFTFTID